MYIMQYVTKHMYFIKNIYLGMIIVIKYKVDINNIFVLWKVFYFLYYNLVYTLQTQQYIGKYINKICISK